jgi:hypothetical protein
LNTKNSENNLSLNIQLLSVAGPSLLQKNDATTLEATKITKCVVCFDHPSTTSNEVFFFLDSQLILQKDIPSCAF